MEFTYQSSEEDNQTGCEHQMDNTKEGEDGDIVKVFNSIAECSDEKEEWHHRMVDRNINEPVGDRMLEKCSVDGEAGPIKRVDSRDTKWFNSGFKILDKGVDFIIRGLGKLAMFAIGVIGIGVILFAKGMGLFGRGVALLGRSLRSAGRSGRSVGSNDRELDDGVRNMNEDQEVGRDRE